jgi:hypothetical protein
VTQRQADETKSVRILVVDDFEPWHDFTANTLKKEPRFEVVGNVRSMPSPVNSSSCFAGRGWPL